MVYFIKNNVKYNKVNFYKIFYCIKSKTMLYFNNLYSMSFFSNINSNKNINLTMLVNYYISLISLKIFFAFLIP